MLYYCLVLSLSVYTVVCVIIVVLSMSVLSQYCILYNLFNNGQYYQSLLILLCCIIVLFYHCLCILWLCYNCCVINVCFIIILCTIHSVLSKSVNTFNCINTFCAYHRYRANMTWNLSYHHQAAIKLDLINDKIQV